MSTNRRLIGFILASGAYIGAGATATAGGFAVARFGGEHGQAAGTEVTAIYYNPAGLSFASGTRFYVEGTLAYRTVDYDRDEGAIDNPGTGTPDANIDANAGPAHLGNVLVSPFIGAASDLGVKGLGVGVGFYAPFGGQAEWDKNDAYVGDPDFPGAEDGVQRWANISGAQRSLYITAAAAYTLPNKKLSFGLGLNVVKSEISLDRARNALGTDDLISEGNALLEVEDTTFSAALGVMYKPDDKLTVGASWQSQPGFGEMTLDGTLATKFGSSPEQVIDVTLHQTLPDVIRVGVEYKANDKLDVRFAADWQRWSVFDEQCLTDNSDPDASCVFNEDGSLDTANGGSGVVVNLPRDWRDTVGVRAGAGYRANDKIEIGGSLSFDSNAVPAPTIDPSLFDMNKFIAQAGVDAQLHKNVSLHATLGQVLYLSRTTHPGTIEVEAPSKNPDMAGTYKQSVTFLLIGVGAAF